MIYLLQGTVATLDEDFAVLNVQGVGYQVFASSRTLARLHEGEAAQLYIYTHVREDHIHLYGFADKAERALFLQLTEVSGVGAKVGLALMSALDVSSLCNAIAGGDVASLTMASGVGKKLAERIVLELKGKIAGVPVLAGGAAGQAAATLAGGGAGADVLSALTNMGFKPQQAQQAVACAMQKAPDADFGALLRTALQELKAS